MSFEFLLRTRGKRWETVSEFSLERQAVTYEVTGGARQSCRSRSWYSQFWTHPNKECSRGNRENFKYLAVIIIAARRENKPLISEKSAHEFETQNKSQK